MLYSSGKKSTPKYTLLSINLNNIPALFSDNFMFLILLSTNNAHLFKGFVLSPILLCIIMFSNTSLLGWSADELLKITPFSASPPKESFIKKLSSPLGFRYLLTLLYIMNKVVILC